MRIFSTFFHSTHINKTTTVVFSNSYIGKCLSFNYSWKCNCLWGQTTFVDLKLKKLNKEDTLESMVWLKTCLPTLLIRSVVSLYKINTTWLFELMKFLKLHQQRNQNCYTFGMEFNFWHWKSTRLDNPNNNSKRRKNNHQLSRTVNIPSWSSAGQFPSLSLYHLQYH